MTSEPSFDPQAMWVINVLGLFFWHVIHVFLYNHALADLWSTCVGIRCLYCTPGKTGLDSFESICGQECLCGNIINHLILKMEMRKTTNICINPYVAGG